MTAAASEGDAQAVAAWLNEGGGVDARCAGRYGETLLMGVAAGGQEAMMRMLLQRGASVNLQNSLGGTALMCAAVNGNTTIVQALLDAKADASLQVTDGSTALMMAEHQKHTATAQLLRQHAKRQAVEAEAVLLRPANLQEFLEPMLYIHLDPVTPTLTLTLTQSLPLTLTLTLYTLTLTLTP